MREDAILWEVKPDDGLLPGQRSLTVMPSQIGIVIRDGEVVDVFESGKRDLPKRGEVRTYVASASPFTLTFWLKDPEDTQEPDEGTVLDQDLPVLTSDGEVATGRIDLTLQQEGTDVGYVLQLLRQGSGGVRRRDLSDAIKGELLAKVLAPNIRGYTAKELSGNRELLDGIEESVNVELASTIQRYGLHLANLTVMWGPTRPVPEEPPIPTRDDPPRQPPTRTPVDPSSVTRAEKYRVFFQPLIDTLREKGFTKATKASGRNWFNTGSGSTKVEYWVEFAGSRGEVRVQVYIGREKEWNKRLFDQLENHKEDIESKLGESLSWERLNHRDACRIALYRDGRINDEYMLDDIREWAIEWMLAFRRVFGPILEELAEEALVMELLRLDRISEAEAAESLDLDRWELIDVMGRYRVPSIRVTPEELRDDLAQSIQDAKRG